MIRQTAVAAVVAVSAFAFTANAFGKSIENAVDVQMEVDYDVLAQDRAHKAILKIALNGRAFDDQAGRAPVNLAIVLDRSGSMAGDKLDRAKAAAIAALNHLGPNDVFSLVTYAHIVETIVPAQRVTDKDQIQQRINAVSPTESNTALFGGISLAAHELRKSLRGNYIHRIIVLSDGKANAGPSNPEDLGRLAIALRKEKMSVTTIGLGVDYDEDVMTALAEKSDGNTYFVKNSTDLSRIFTAELGDVLSVVAKNVDINVEIPKGLNPTRIIGRQGTIDGQNVHLNWNQIYGGQEKYALVEVDIPANMANGDLEIANATVSYENSGDGNNVLTGTNMLVNFTNMKPDGDGQPNMSVVNPYENNKLALNRDEAITLAEQGKTAAAVNVLRDNSERLRQKGQKNNDAQLLEAAEETEQQADEISKKGMSAEMRKKLRAQSWQFRNTQKVR